MGDADLKSAVEAVEKAKIEVVGIGIGDEAVRRFYPKNVVVGNISNLAGETMKQLASFF